MCSAASDTSDVPTRNSSSSGDAVDLRLVAGQEAGADERLAAHQHGRVDRDEALGAERVDGEPRDRHPQHGDVAHQVARTASRTCARRAPCRSTGRRWRGGRAARTRTAAARRPPSRPRRPPRGRRAGRTGAGRFGSCSMAASNCAADLGQLRPRARRALPSARAPRRGRGRRRTPPRGRPSRASSPRRSAPRRCSGALRSSSTWVCTARRRSSSEIASSSSPSALRRASAVRSISGSLRSSRGSSMPEL